MDARDWRLIKIFTKNFGFMLLVFAAVTGLGLLMDQMPQIYRTIAGGVALLGFAGYFVYLVSDHQLGRAEHAEQQLANRLADSD
jgi:threonine/homoserine/homoserine lactone efflux protein